MSVEKCYSSAEVFLYFHSKVAQNGWWPRLKLKIGPLKTQNAYLLHCVDYRSSRMTNISARFHYNLERYFTVEIK
jgi:hypothetical protein